MSMHRIGSPYIVSIDATAVRAEALPRLPLGDRTADIDELWLQRLIDKVPSVLPVRDVDTRISGALTSLGREINTPSGPIDNLLIARSGHLVVVETKLWRNPQARREVVAQILDYAGHVREWDYAKLEALWKVRHGGSHSLYQGLAPDDDEATWIDSVNDSLAAGEMLLLIAGDGIESRASVGFVVKKKLGQQGGALLVVKRPLCTENQPPKW